MREVCGNCRFYEPQSEEDPAGYCRRYPPGLDNGIQDQPFVEQDDWCGEWKPKKRPKKSDDQT